MKVYNAENIILGRLCSQVAKDALLGEQVVIVNCEKAIISGSKDVVLAREKWKWDRRGYPLKSPKYSRLPDRFVRKTVRRMLPFKNARGREAYKQVMCYVGVPADFAGKEMVSLKKLSVSKLPTMNYISVGQICKLLGGKV
jgi:large subunit ribosomal protein L13